MRTKILAVLTLFLLMFSTATAAEDWTINADVVQPPDVAENEHVIVTMQLLNHFGEPVAPEDCESLYARYRYYTPANKTMQYVPGSEGIYWANLTVNSSDQTLYIEGEGLNCPAFNDGSGSKDVSFSNTADFTIDYHNRSAWNSDQDRYLEGVSYPLAINVTDPNDRFVKNVSAEWTIYEWDNDTSTSTLSVHSQGMMDLGMNNTSFSADIPTPADSKGLYFLSFRAENSSLNYNNPFGAEAFPFYIETRLESEMRVNNTNLLCDNQINPQRCQKDSRLQVTFRETDNSANNVIAWLQGKKLNSSFWNNTRQWIDAGVNLSATNMTEINDTHWQANFTIPRDFNTTTYGRYLDIRTKGVNVLSHASHLDRLFIWSFKPISETGTYVFRGNDLELIFGPVYPYSGKPLDRALTQKIDLHIINSNDTKVVDRTFTKPIPDKNWIGHRKLFKYDYGVPLTAPVGEYRFNINITDIYGIKYGSKHLLTKPWSNMEADDWTFTVYNSSAIASDIRVSGISSGIQELQSTSQLRKTFLKAGIKKGTILLENEGEAGAAVNVTITGDLKGHTTAMGDSRGKFPFSMTEETAEVVNMTFNMSDYTNYTGQIIFNIVDETNLEYSIPLDYNFTVERECRALNGSICLRSAAEIQREYNQNTEDNITFELRNTNESGWTNLTIEPFNNLTTLFRQTKDLNMAPGAIAEVNFPIQARNENNDTYTGEFLIRHNTSEWITVPTAINISVPPGSVDLRVLRQNSLGQVVHGNDSIEIPVNIKNSGNVDILSIELAIPKFSSSTTLTDANGSSLRLSPGEAHNASIKLYTSRGTPGEYNNVDLVARPPGQTGFIGQTALSIEVIPDISSNISELETRIETLKNNLDQYKNNGEISASAHTELYDKVDTDLTNRVDEARTAFENATYDEAQDALDEAQQIEQNIEDSIETAREQSDQEDEDNGSPGGDGNETTPPDEDDNDNNGGGGGINPILIVIPVVVLLVIGVVVYLSLVPEEGETETPSFGR